MDWETLHRQERFRPKYPAEPAVRWVKSLPDGRGKKALDIGCGAGRHIQLLYDHNYQYVHGVDLSFTGLLCAFRYPGSVIQASMTALPFGNETFDACLSYGSLYYSTRQEMEQAIAEMYRVLVPGGRAFVVTRTTYDSRFLMTDPDTGIVTKNDTNEQGMKMTFLREKELAVVFSSFSEMTYEKTETSWGGIRHLNSDWLVSLVK